MKNILKDIIKKKKDTILSCKKNLSETLILKNIKEINNFINFKDKLNKLSIENKISVIAEIKKKSPSAGNIVENFDHLNIAKIFIENGAEFLSVLTEENFFLGKLDYIKNIKNHYKIPILCKDFFVDTYQVALAKSYGADCILIILSAVDKIQAKDLYQAANDLDISTIVEVHDESEAEAALDFSNSLIGINNRNLDTLEVSIDTSINLSKILKSHSNALISESGINSTEDMKTIINKAKIFNFLIGESLLKSNDMGMKLKEFLKISS